MNKRNKDADHIEMPDGTAKFRLEPLISLATFYNLSEKDLHKIESIVSEKKMISLKNGTDTSDYEITNIERFGIWFLVDDKEYNIKFEDYPALKKSIH